ncbi:hypothetical protein Pmani_025696 [Petrolisthes manimaculis]|uniref:Uncharacterized protein n=1 Tax=Petrolisthes manimaculis TaxID=1843537 RepID=A0AAE1P515_9EUCA|nr:hypothetical protein Pmani_025696 [Petrolisthes manimaculis]
MLSQYWLRRREGIGREGSGSGGTIVVVGWDGVLEMRQSHVVGVCGSGGTIVVVGWDGLLEMRQSDVGY